MEQSPKLGLSVDGNDVKYISGLSTILVASIQEAKDKISQIEYIFCSQLYPNFQSKCKGLEKIYAEAKKEAEDAWKKKENEFNLLLEELELEKKKVVEENHSFLLEKEKLQKENEEKMRQLVVKLQSQETKIEELKGELMLKCKEVDEGMELHSKLVQLVQAKASVIADKGKELKEHEEKTNLLLSDLNNLRKKVEENYKELHVALGKKTDEVEEGRKSQEQLLRQIDLEGSEILKNKQQLEENEKIKERLLAKVKSLELKINELQAAKLSRSGNDAHHAGEERDLYEKLLKQIEAKASELVAEKKKKRDLLDAYKRLKSQYNYLCRKNGLTTENMSFPNKLEDESDSARHHDKSKPSLDAENRILKTPMVVFGTESVKDVIGMNGDLEDEKGVKPIETSTSHSSRKCPSNTRSHQGQARHDPHDDFLDTPLENIRGNLEKAMKKEACDPLVQDDMNVDSSDDETHDVSVDKKQQKQETPFQMVDKGSFKYVEPVRKKAEREKLKGYECNQCKKFYDAVLSKGAEGNEDHNKNFRCEHHDGVSRHRYKYVPPMTPEGFWNIGFESEM
ncbi:hypothetical protein GOBAR_AA15453 [Gossypium barbadense]|uniref:DNA endonuclease activator Ctp1 C-terminal domain-containing protein n=1 Tax=Gossypium barbadense TaxID=3634 RepID=A0A2P5XPB9_GOSBA|nr:hypothetical protein GOBAR_AA15453 [Gossypium barbadense]